ncbi:MAG: endonuclease/exonuclease/phosphatase family protein [Planctomycetes bacterium]|nr:endonuclease/exonuclease/phosphatase family protein [Planctomycetota bacterium]
MRTALLRALALSLIGFAASAVAQEKAPAPTTLRIATFNIEDVRADDVNRNDNPRLKAVAEVIQRISPNIIFLNEIAYDMPGAPGWKDGDAPGQNAAKFVENYLNTAQAPGLTPIRYKAFMAPVNTGVFSGFDLDNDGKVIDFYPPPPGTKPDGSPGEQTPAGRAYGNDCFGFGTFPGQYGMALLVDERLTIDESNVRTFQRLPWDYVVGNFMPSKADGTPWFTDEEKAAVRLSSKSHWDVPVKLPNGSELHVLCSHPTPPVFDGPEDRNGRRNHDEIRFWMDYLANEPYVVDDNSKYGGMGGDASFVIVGDLNADPKKGDSFKNPISKLMSARRVSREFTPKADIEVSGLESTDTSMFKMRVDYVLPSKDLKVEQGGVWRTLPSASKDGKFPSDHFPVWIDVVVPAPKK